MSKWYVRTPKQLLRSLVDKAYEKYLLHMITARDPFRTPPHGKIGEFTTNLDEKDSELLKNLKSDDAQDGRITPLYHDRIKPKADFSKIQRK